MRLAAHADHTLERLGPHVEPVRVREGIVGPHRPVCLVDRQDVVRPEQLRQRDEERVLRQAGPGADAAAPAKGAVAVLGRVRAAALLLGRGRDVCPGQVGQRFRGDGVWEEAQGVEVVRVRIVLGVQVDGPRVGQDRGALGDVVSPVDVGGGVGVRRPPQHGDGANTKDLEAEGFDIGQLWLVGEGGSALRADDGVQLGVGSLQGDWVGDEHEDAAAEGAGSGIAARAKERGRHEGEVALAEQGEGVRIGGSRLEEDLGQRVGHVGRVFGAPDLALDLADEGHVHLGLEPSAALDLGLPGGEVVGDVLEEGQRLDKEAPGDVERRRILHELEALADDPGVHRVDAVAVRDAEDHAGREAVDQRLVRRRVGQQGVNEARGLGLLDGLVQAQRRRVQRLVQQPAADLPGLAIRLDQDARVVPVQLAHDDEARPRAVLVAALLEQVDRHVGVRDDDRRPPADPEREDGAVDV